MKLIGDEPAKKIKSLALRSVGQPSKSSQVWEYEEATARRGSEEG